MPLDLTPYYMRFDRAKGYKRHLFRDSKGFQSAEGNEQHDYLLDNFRMFTDALVGDGAIMQGSLAYLNELATMCSLEEGAIIAEGYVIQYEAAEVVINAVDTFSIGIAVLSEIITELEDPDLRDPALGTINYNEPGAHVIKVTGRWALSDDYDPLTERFYPVHRIVQGNIVSQQPNAAQNIMEPILELVARYDRGSNGHYIVNGMDVVYLSEDATNKKHNLSIVAGLAHVFGYEINFTSDFSLKIDWATDERFVNNEPAQFNGDGWYSLRESPIARMGEVFGIKETTDNITHGGFSGAKDELPQQPVVKINSVTQGATVYIEDTDWFQNGNYVDWSIPGSEPAPGSTYTVTWEYNEEITETVVISDDRLSIQVQGLKPGTVFFADYWYYLPRWDKINLLRNGDVFVTKGVPADEDEIVKPVNNEGLPLASVKVYFGRDPVIEYEGYRAYLTKDLKRMEEDIDELRYNVSRLSQMADTNAKDPTTNKKNMFVDPFYDDDLRDAGLENNAIIMDGILTPAMEWTDGQIREGGPILLGFTEQLVINQTAYTKTRKVNEFDHADHKTVIKCSPASMRWISSSVGSRQPPTQIDDKNAQIPTSTVLNITGGRYASQEQVEIYVDNVLATTASSDVDGNIDITFNIPAGVKSGIKEITAGGLTSNALGRTTFIANAIQQRVAIIQKVINNTVIIEKKVPVSKFDRRYGDLPADLRAKARGHLARGYGSDRLWKHYQQCMAAGHTLAWCVRNDPLAQTFKLPETGFINSCEVFFTKIPMDPDEIVEISINATQVGIPDREDLIVNIEVPASSLTVNAWNKLSFKYPVKLDAEVEYAMVVFTRDTDTFIRVAEIGAYDLQNNIWLSSQVHDGVLLQSANRSTWSAIPKEDMTFKINYALFEDNAQILLGELDLVETTDLNLTATAEILSGTDVTFWAELEDRDNELVPLNAGKTTKIVEYTGNAKFYAKLETTDDWLSPTLDGDITITYGKVVFPSTYISRLFTIDGDDFKAYVDIFEPNQSTVKVFYQDYTAAIGTIGGELDIVAVADLGPDGNFQIDIINNDGVTAGSEFAVWDSDTDTMTVHIDSGFSTQNDIKNALETQVNQIDSVTPANPGNTWTISSPTNDSVELSGGDRWKEMTRNPTEATPIGDGWVDTLWEADVTGLTNMRVKVELDTLDNFNRPFAENLRTYAY